VPTGVKIEKQSDGTTLFVDYDNKYQIVLPSDWAAVSFTEEEFDQAAGQIIASDPNFQQMAEGLKNVDSDAYRLAAFNINRSYMNGTFPSLLTINAFSDSMAGTMPMAFVTAMIEDTVLKDATSTTWEVVDNANKVEIGIVKGTRKITFPNGLSTAVQELVISFQANKKLIVVEIATPGKFGDQILSPVEESIDFIKTDI